MQRRIMMVLFIPVVLCALSACSPVTLQKCHKDYKYDSNGKLIGEYQECITQTPEKTLPIHIKHQELYE
jgi:hypothetical protein